MISHADRDLDYMWAWATPARSWSCNIITAVNCMRAVTESSYHSGNMGAGLTEVSLLLNISPMICSPNRIGPSLSIVTWPLLAFAINITTTKVIRFIHKHRNRSFLKATSRPRRADFRSGEGSQSLLTANRKPFTVRAAMAIMLTTLQAF